MHHNSIKEIFQLNFRENDISIGRCSALKVLDVTLAT